MNRYQPRLANMIKQFKNFESNQFEEAMNKLNDIEISLESNVKQKSVTD